MNNLRIITGASSYHEDLTGDVEFCYLELTPAQVRQAVERMNLVRAARNTDHQLLKAIYSNAVQLKFIKDGDPLADLREANTGERFEKIRPEIEDIETGRVFRLKSSESIDDDLLDNVDDGESVIYPDCIIFKGEPGAYSFFVGTPTIPRHIFEEYLAELPLAGTAPPKILSGRAMSKEEEIGEYPAAGREIARAMIGSYVRAQVDAVLETVAQEADEGGEKQAIRDALLREADELDPEGRKSPH